MRLDGRISRRGFIKHSAAAVAFPTIVPASALGLGRVPAPGNRVAMGFIGVGGKGTGGMRNFMSCADCQVVAVCDVNRAARDEARNLAQLAESAAYNDFRELFARDDIDAVQVATPDHWHVLASMAAIEAGKDVYCEKPLSNTLAEGRALVDSVRRHGAVFQHGTQLRSLRNVRFACELVRNGRIGHLHTIRIGSPAGYATDRKAEEPVPEGFDYDLWLGPAPWAPYTPWRVKVPGQLPGWYFVSDYSTSGWVAGYGVHDMDIAFWGMGDPWAGPIEVEGRGVSPRDGLYDTVLTYHLEYRFANGVRLIMTTLDETPRHGVCFEGDEGWVYTRSDIDAEPKSLLQEKIGPEETHLYESVLHEQNFLDCVKTRAKTITPEDVAHQACATALVGGIALALRRKVIWDPTRETFVDDAEANRLRARAMRPPWRV
ncbi:MAG TPA: Gfo/Idh/MocA family oxidoreductase [Candidatus Hydrogenedentes bacterium]|nr:Gfo/Idh/MocA family oxidoreductase [Candidatus Hydrogenedentota bacterium]HPG66896.1 Gfo/Idh/MocA family oxidoreductase [Candidatus Hydrogenedentota bacterium]